MKTMPFLERLITPARLTATRSRITAGIFVLVLLTGLTACDAQNAGQSEKPAPRPNIVFILVDTLRADRLGCLGNPAGYSPTMDEAAREGVLFERAIASSSWTLPSVASYFCGYFPSVHKVTSYDAALSMSHESGSVRYFGDEFTTLAEVLQANGYLTAGFSANPFITEKFGFAQGFDHFDDAFAANETPGRAVNDAALKWLAQRDASKPFYLYLHYMDVHDPYMADAKFVEPLVDAVARLPVKTPVPREQAKRHRPYFSKSAFAYKDTPKHAALFGCVEYWRARYDSGVPQIDAYLAQLRARLTEMGLWDETFVIITADHGESLGEHGLWAHGLSAHQDQLHVPLILRWPGNLPSNKRIDETVRLFDVMPTVLDQLRIDFKDPIQARSLSPLINGDAGEPPPAFAEAVKKKPANKALVVGEWKLLAYLDQDRFELYNLDQDPTEQRDLASRQPERVAQLKKSLVAQIEENRKLGENVQESEKSMTDREMDRLKALGYIGGEEEEDEEEAAPVSRPASAPTSTPTSVPTSTPEPDEP